MFGRIDQQSHRVADTGLIVCNEDAHGLRRHFAELSMPEPWNLLKKW
jgi:hypothetical protein